MGAKLALMNGQTLQKAFVPLTGGATAVYTASGLSYYRHSDWLGSSRLASTPTRTVYSTTAYAPFGEPYAQSGTTDLSFTGQNQDTAGGSYDFLAREYAIQGRWPSPDPAGLAAVNPMNPQSWNRYAYVLNSPLMSIDPFGLCDPATSWDTSNVVCANTDTYNPSSVMILGDLGLPYDLSPRGNGLIARIKSRLKKNKEERNPKCPGWFKNSINNAIINSTPLFQVAALAALTTGKVVTVGYDASLIVQLGTLGAGNHASDVLAFDPKGNVAWVSTTGSTYGFGGETAGTIQLGIMSNTKSVFDLENGTAIAAGGSFADGIAGGFSVDGDGTTTVSLGFGEGVSTAATFDISNVKVVACQQP